MSGKLLLDTNAVIAVLAGDEDILAVVSPADECLFTKAVTQASSLCLVKTGKMPVLPGNKRRTAIQSPVRPQRDYPVSPAPLW